MSRSTHILSIDQGTTGSTILLVDTQGNIVSQSYQEFTQHYPRPGWVEHDPDEIWNATQNGIVEVLNSLESQERPVAIGITNQRETTVVWDRPTGKPIYPAIVWQCRRTADVCANFKAQKGVAEQVKAKTGLVIDPYFSGTKVVGLFSFIDIHFIKLTVSKGFDAYSFILSAIRVMP